jgi:hypothetical protein
MTMLSGIEDKRWEQLAQQQKWSQLDGARRQAEGWRNGLTGLTALLAAVTIVSGPDNVDGLALTTRTVVVALLGAGFAALVAGSLMAVRAAHGAPTRIYLKGPALKAWTRDEVRRIGVLIRWAGVLLIVGLLAVAASVGVTWLASPADVRPTVRVVTIDTKVCGELLSVDHDSVVLDVNPAAAEERVVLRLDRLVSLTPAACG